MKAFILAAGEGERLNKITKYKPKVLIEINEKPIIEYVVSAVKKNRIKEINIVVNYKKELIKNSNIKGVNYIHIPFKNKGNIFSLLSIKNFVKEDFLLLMGDTIIDPKIITKLINYKIKNRIRNKLILCVDRDLNKPKWRINDSVKVLTKYDKIIEIGKKIKKYDYLDTGVFIMPKDIFNIFEKQLTGNEKTLSKAVRLLAEQKRAQICNITELFWWDIDFPEDLEIVEKQNLSFLY